MDMVFQYGQSSTSFLTLYEGFRYFKKEIAGKTGLVAYVNTPTAWVGAADPAAPAEIQAELLLAFLKEAKKVKGVGIILPASKAMAEAARAAGHYAVQIGSEPWFSLESKTSYSINVAKRLFAKGAIVEHFDPIQLSAREYQQFDDITQEWLESRASVPLSFLNRVEPWLYVQHKRYYRINYQGRSVGYLAAVPVTARNSWYLVDLIRLPNAPVGATELLISKAIEELQAEGASEVTLGMSPLAAVDEEEFAQHPRTYRFLDFVYRKSNSFYGFQTLFEYKEKLKPTRWEPLYLIAHPRLNARAGYGFFRALFPSGILITSFAVALKKIRKIDLSSAFTKMLSQDIVPRSAPRSWRESLYRRKVVLSLAATQLLFYFVATDPTGHAIRPNMEQRYGYTLQRFITSGLNWDNLKALVISSFLHENITHLLFNLVTLTLFAGTFEVLAGSGAVGICYLLGILFSNPLTSLALYPLIDLVDPKLLATFTQSVDVGCSLGVFACVGALTHFIQRQKLVLALLTLVIFASAAVDIKLLDLNHIVAISIGLIFGRYYAPKR
jgi:membrane associated rhomboid family serine protease